VINDLSELRHEPVHAVIINCGTKWVTSLALLSTLRNTDCQVLIVDCESKDGSREHFQKLSVRYKLPFAWLAWPLRPHPATLDRLFAGIASEAVLLVDSDVEMKTRAVFDAMHSALSSDRDAYGAGFLHGPQWMGADHGLLPYTGYYEERMWIPCVLLRTSAVKRALEAGSSLTNRRAFFEIPSRPALSRLLGYRYRIRGLRRLPLWTACGGDMKRPMYEGRFPAFVEYDTGADLHAELKRRGHAFAALPAELWGDVHHFHGVTRASLTGRFRRMAKALRLASRNTETEPRSVLETVRERLSAVYGVAEI
jgi:hypothetical protein